MGIKWILSLFLFKFRIYVTCFRSTGRQVTRRFVGKAGGDAPRTLWNGDCKSLISNAVPYGFQTRLVCNEKKASLQRKQGFVGDKRSLVCKRGIRSLTARSRSVRLQITIYSIDDGVGKRNVRNLPSCWEWGRGPDFQTCHHAQGASSSHLKWPSSILSYIHCYCQCKFTANRREDGFTQITIGLQ